LICWIVSNVDNMVVVYNFLDYLHFTDMIYEINNLNYNML